MGSLTKVVWSFLEKSDRVAAKLLYHITVYAGLTLYRSADTWTPTSEGASQKDRLSACISQLDVNPGLLVADIHYGHGVVKDMRNYIGLPQPEPPAPTAATWGPLAKFKMPHMHHSGQETTLRLPQQTRHLKHKPDEEAEEAAMLTVAAEREVEEAADVLMTAAEQDTLPAPALAPQPAEAWGLWPSSRSPTVGGGFFGI